MGGIKAWKKANRVTHDPPGTIDPVSEHELSSKKKKKNAARKLKSFWEKKKQQQKNLSPKSDALSLKDAIMQLPMAQKRQGERIRNNHGNNGNAAADAVLSPRTAPETVDSSPDQPIQVLIPNSSYERQKQHVDQKIFRRQKEAPGQKGFEITEVIIDRDDQIGQISPITIDTAAFLAQPKQRQPGVPREYQLPSTHYTEGVGVEMELAEALLQLPSLNQKSQRKGGRGRGILDDLASENESSSSFQFGAPGVGAHRHRFGNGTGGIRREPNIAVNDNDNDILSSVGNAIDLTNVETEQQAKELVQELKDPKHAFDDIDMKLTAVPDVFGSLTDLLRDPPADGTCGNDNDDDDDCGDNGSVKAESKSINGTLQENEGLQQRQQEADGTAEHRDDDNDLLVKKKTVDVMRKENTKGAPFDPIDLTDCDYRLFVRKPAEAINIGLVEDADEVYDEMINTSSNIVTKATHHLLGRNNTWYLG